MNKKITPVNISAIIALFFIFINTTAFAGGLYISEFGTPSMGVAGAGSQAVASDASTAFHNPAGMTRLDGKQLMLTGGVLYSTVKFDKDADTPLMVEMAAMPVDPRPYWASFTPTVFRTDLNWAPI